MTRHAPVCKLGHVALSTPDLDASLRFFSDLVGLDVVGEQDGAVYLRAWGEVDIFDTDWEPVRWDEHNITTGMVWFGPDFVPGAGGPMDATTPRGAEAAVVA